jgi:ketosteroid isomerase-like protein
MIRTQVEALYEAFAARDPVRIAGYLAHDVEWQMDGPVAIFPFCGHRRGKAAVLDLLTRLKPSILPTKRMDPEDVVIDGNQAAAFVKTTAVHKQTGRVVVFHCAHFFTFRDGQLAAMHCVADTYDAAEQVMGHRIDAYHEPAVSNSEDIIAI